MGAFDLDPASCEEANQTVKATKFYGAADNGLEHEWYGKIWLNPPYSMPEISIHR
jgi:ParB family transcriptional regulator, chromosome partitioning protein